MIGSQAVSGAPIGPILVTLAFLPTLGSNLPSACSGHPRPPALSPGWGLPPSLLSLPGLMASAFLPPTPPRFAGLKTNTKK